MRDVKDLSDDELEAEYSASMFVENNVCDNEMTKSAASRAIDCEHEMERRGFEYNEDGERTIKP